MKEENLPCNNRALGMEEVTEETGKADDAPKKMYSKEVESDDRRREKENI